MTDQKSSSSNTTDTPSSNESVVVLSIFFCGTADSIASGDTMVSQFFDSCLGLDITDPSKSIQDHITQEHFEATGKSTQFKLGFDGCAITNGTLGLIFGAGLSDQCNFACKRIQELHNFTRMKVRVNAFGLSRGAIACFILAKQMQNMVYPSFSSFFAPIVSSRKNRDSFDDWAELNILAFDPVPGNFVFTSTMDFCNISHANNTCNLTDCTVISSAFTLYPYEPLPDMACHAPLIPRFPPGVSRHDVILGCHAGAMWNFRRPVSVRYAKEIDGSLTVYISYAYILNWFQHYHSDILQNDLQAQFPDWSHWMCQKMDDALLQNITSTRSTHSYGNKQIVRTVGAQYLNKCHYILKNCIEYSKPDSVHPEEAVAKPETCPNKPIHRLELIKHILKWQESENPFPRISETEASPTDVIPDFSLKITGYYSKLPTALPQMTEEKL